MNPVKHHWNTECKTHSFSFLHSVFFKCFTFSVPVVFYKIRIPSCHLSPSPAPLSAYFPFGSQFLSPSFSRSFCDFSFCDFSLAPLRRAPSGLSSGQSTADDYCLSSSDDRSLSSSDDRSLSFLAPLAPHSVCVAGEVVVWTGLYLLAAPGLSSPGALVLSAASVRSPLHPTPLSLFTSTLHPCPCCPKPHSLAPCHCGRLHVRTCKQFGKRRDWPGRLQRLGRQGRLHSGAFGCVRVRSSACGETFQHASGDVSACFRAVGDGVLARCRRWQAGALSCGVTV